MIKFSPNIKTQSIHQNIISDYTREITTLMDETGGHPATDIQRQKIIGDAFVKAVEYFNTHFTYLTCQWTIVSGS
jgi:hypothetical protein